LDIHELSGVFSDCESEMVSSSIEEGSSVLGIALPGFSGRLGKKTSIENGAQLPRLGRELASSARMAGVSGIFHSDELPSYGIGPAEVDAVRSEMALSEGDAFVLCVAPRWQGELALEAVVYRARMAFHRIPQEVRNVVIRKGKPEDGTTTALRPLPGGARMYPETDIPVLEISPDRWSSICENLPLTIKERKERLNVLDLSSNQVEALLNGEVDDLLFHGVEGPLGLPPKAWASALLESGTDKPNALAASVHLRERGLLTREGAETLLAESVEAPAEELVSWMSSESESRGFMPADTSSIEEAVDAVIRERSDFIEERGMGAVGPLMGMVMQKLGVSADGKAVSKILRDRIDEKIG
jgi:glutamyl-tRNA(Gln) amidotransferase subunit E